MAYLSQLAVNQSTVVDLLSQYLYTKIQGSTVNMYKKYSVNVLLFFWNDNVILICEIFRSFGLWKLIL